MEVEKKTLEILIRCVDKDVIFVDNWKEANFFGKKINIAPRSLVLFFITLEKEFKIEFQNEEIKENRFVTFNEILKLLKEKL